MDTVFKCLKGHQEYKINNTNCALNVLIICTRINSKHKLLRFR